MRELILYTTSACHLCEKALAIVQPVMAEAAFRDVALREFDIADSDALIERYGVRIPVLQLGGTLRELGWPFDESDIRRLLESIRRPA